MTFKEAIETININAIGFTWFESAIYEGLGNRNVIGYNVKAPSFVRKDITIKRLNEIIKAFNLPLVIKDYHENINSFQIIKIDEALGVIDKSIKQ